MSIPVVARTTQAEVTTLAATPAGEWAWVEIRSTIKGAQSVRLRVLPPTSQRPRAYAKAPGTRYFVTDSHVLDVLELDCRAR
jgi:hypothetical protein